MKNFDFLVLGSGIAGLSFALKTAPFGRVAIVTKKSRAESNTNYAQGGIAAVTSREDSFARHVADTLEAGAGLCHQDAVRTIVEEGPARIAELIELGMKFSEREVNGARELDLGREGGHSKRRILHAKDVTGREIERALLAAVAAQPNIEIFENHIAIDLITTQKIQGGANFSPAENRCVGAYVLDKNRNAVETFSARAVLLATGGCGKVYLYTTNPDIATGDGVAMAYRAGAGVANMEFIQFHPTCLYSPRAKSFLISEAVRGEGGILKNVDGRALHGPVPSAQVAGAAGHRGAGDRQRDEEERRRVCSCLTSRTSPRPLSWSGFPNIYSTCLEFGIDITREPIPVVPAAHYQCGGVVTTVDGQTEIPGSTRWGRWPARGCTGPTAWPAIRCWKRWFARTAPRPVRRERPGPGK